MSRLSKEDLGQMNRNYFQSLDKEKLVEVAGNLHSLAVEQLEKLEKNSSNSSLPPSSDLFKSRESLVLQESQQQANPQSETNSEQKEKQVKESTQKNNSKGFEKKKPGKQPGADGLWRTTPLVPEQIIPHYPENCASCNSPLKVDPDAKSHMGYYVLELEKKDSGVEVICTLHLYYQTTRE
jgi:transposase